MREPVELDVRGIWAELSARPDKAQSGGYRIFTNDQQWIIWLQFNRIPQKELARAMHSGADRVAVEYKKLKEQGGPKGKRPEWMK